MIKINPELQRYYWSEFSLQRIILLPILAGIIIFITSQIPHSPEETISIFSKNAFVLLILLWGGNKASNSIAAEVRENTWDWQRLSSVSPSSITFGKIIGSTLYCWYGAIIALFTYIFSSITILQLDILFCNVILLVTAGLMCHAIAIFLNLIVIEKNFTNKKGNAFGAHIIAIALSSIVIMPVFEGINKNVITWYGNTYNSLYFYTFFSVVFLAWMLIATYWKMRSQIKMRTSPYLFINFLFFMIFFVNGLDFIIFAISRLHQLPFVSFGLCGVFFYGFAFAESYNGILYRKLIEKWKSRKYSNFIDIIPRWIISLFFAIISLFCLTLYDIPKYDGEIQKIAFILLFFAIRDVAILNYFVLNPKSSRSTGATFFYMLILYAIIPLLLKSLKLNDYISLFLFDFHNINVALYSIAAQMLFCITLAYRNWKKYWQ